MHTGNSKTLLHLRKMRKTKFLERKSGPGIVRRAVLGMGPELGVVVMVLADEGKIEHREEIRQLEECVARQTAVGLESLGVERKITADESALLKFLQDPAELSVVWERTTPEYFLTRKTLANLGKSSHYGNIWLRFLEQGSVKCRKLAIQFRICTEEKPVDVLRKAQ